MLGLVTQSSFVAEKAKRKTAEAALEAEVQKRTNLETDLKAETEKRIGAESVVSVWKSQAEGLTKTLSDQAELIERTRLAHANQVALILKHVAPLAPPSAPLPPSEERPAPTWEEIMQEPASTKREMLLRRLRAHDARRKAEEGKNSATQTRSTELMSEDERRAMMPDVDSTLGIFMDMPKPEGEAPNDSIQ